MSNDGPKIYVVADSEGPTGVAEYWARNLPPTSPRLRPFRELMTGDVNAAVQGCFNAGASAVVVKDDGFRDRNLLPELLDPRAQLILSGGPLLKGLDEHFAGVMLVGFHAMEGATDAVLAHTWSSARRRRYWFNGREGGELAAYAIAAGHDHGVPIIMATGCTGLCREAHAWLGQDLVTVPVKQLRPDGTVDLFPAADTHPQIRAGARVAVERAHHCQPYRTRFPLAVRLQLTDPETTTGYVAWRRQHKPDWPARRTGPCTLAASLHATHHLVL